MSLAHIRNKKLKEGKDNTELNKIELTTIEPGDESNYPKKGDTICVHYTLTLMDGTKIDDTYARDHPLLFTLGRYLLPFNSALLFDQQNVFYNTYSCIHLP